jgi:hypothetical protein
MTKILILILATTACGGSAFSTDPLLEPPDAAQQHDAGSPVAVAPQEAAAPVPEAAPAEAAAVVTPEPAPEPTPEASAPEAAPEACALVTHSNGIGATWQNCSPVSARAACEHTGPCTLSDGAGGVCNGAGSTECVCWDPDGKVRVGTWPNGSCNAMAVTGMWK